MDSILELKPLTRVEGHGSLRVYREDRHAVKVELALIESPRLFEALLLGKSYAELPEIICRICSICSTVHRLTSLAAIERAFAVEVSERTRLLRELLLHGGTIASHALHLYCLVLPDLFGASGFADLPKEATEELRLGLQLKAAGNLVQETVGGRVIHPVTPIPGTMGGHGVKYDQLQRMRDTLVQLKDVKERVVILFATTHSSPSQLSTPLYLAVEEADSPLAGTRLKLSDGRTTPVNTYRSLLQETPIAHGNALQSTADGAIVTVGALARINLGEARRIQADGRLADTRKQLKGADIRANSLAQVIELFDSIERAIELVTILLARDFPPEPVPVIEPKPGTGIAALEAPRGTLIHNYHFDSRGVCTAADIVTPTAINQVAMERDLLTVAREFDGAEEQELVHALEVLVRAYDPCISCAVHLIER